MGTIWEQCKQLLRSKVNEHTMSTWLDPIVCEEVSDDKITFSVPNNFFILWIRDNYLSKIRESLTEVTGRRFEMEFKSRDEFRKDLPVPPIQTETSSDLYSSLSITDEFALNRNLNPRYTFESFVVGSCNQFPRAAALAVAENLGATYNPLFIYGGVGLGKTHLMSAVGYQVLSNDKSRKVYFTTAEEFTNEMINALRYDKMVEFRNKYRTVDLLMMDDIQFIARKERTQEEFFHTFNSLYEARKQIIITSDRFPGDIEDMEHRLQSRFGWGLVADIGVPDLETKVAILKRKAYEDSMELPNQVAYFLAEQVESNIRELVGYLIRVVAMSTLQGVPLTRDLAQEALREIISRKSKAITIDTIIAQVSKAYNVRPADLKSKKKHKLYSFPRQIGMFLARELTDMSYPEIGTAFGGKDHTTVIYATRKIEQQMEHDHALRSQVEAIKKDIRG